MAPLPPNSTSRYFADYQFGVGQQHTFEVRYGGAETPLSVGARVAAYLDDLRALRPASWSFVAARYQVAGSDFALPTDPPGILVGTAAELNPTQYPSFCSFVGRGSTSGRRVRWTLFGLVVPTPGDYRFQPGEVAALDTVLEALQAGPEETFLTIAGDVPVWNSYINFGYNSYWERQQRL